MRRKRGQLVLALWRCIKSSIPCARNSYRRIDAQSKVRRFAFHKDHSGFVWIIYWEGAKGGKGSTSEAIAVEEVRDKGHLNFTGKED